MRFLKIVLSVLGILLLQTVVFPRLNFFGVMPDLVLVSAIVFAVFEERNPATLFSAGVGFLQDLFSTGGYYNTLIKVVAGNVISNIKDEFAGEEYSFAVTLVAVFTPIIFAVQGAFFFFFLDKHFSWSYLIFKLVFGTAYNLILLPVLFPLVKALTRGD